MKKVRESAKLLKEFLLIPIIMGVLLILTGTIGILSSYKSANDLTTFHQGSVRPIIEFQQIALGLKDLSNDILVYGLTYDPQKKKRIETTIESIHQQIRLKLSDYENSYQGDFFRRWLGTWNNFRVELVKALSLPTGTQFPAMELNKQNVKLIDNINAIVLSIDTDLKEEFIQNNDNNERMIYTLVLILVVGIALGAFTSFRVVRKINHLYIMVLQNKQAQENLINNLNQGFMVIGLDGVVSAGSTLAAHEYFGTDPTGRLFQEILQLNEADSKIMVDWYEMVFSGSIDFESMIPLAPKSFEKIKDHYIELEYRPIYNEETLLVDKVICIATDRTEFKRLKEKAEKENALVQMVLLLLKDREGFREFIQDAKQLIVSIADELDQEKVDMEVLSRQIHSLKGTASTYRLIEVCQGAKDFEDKLANWRDTGSKNTPELITELKKNVTRIHANFQKFLKEYAFIFDDVAAIDKQVVEMSLSKVKEISGVIQKTTGSDSLLYRLFVEEFIEADIKSLFQRYANTVSELAKKHGKEVDFYLLDSKIKVYLDPYRPLATSMVHAFRNAVDHGIETDSEREAVGKKEKGIIYVHFEKFVRKGTP
ncbi:MAG: Hpt domain-containing protein, partial [Pseudomonadota bacterium]